MPTKTLLSTIESFLSNPVFHFGVETLGRDEKMYVTGYIQALVENGFLAEKDVDKFWDKIKEIAWTGRNN